MMRTITDIGWLDTHKWGVRGFTRGGKSPHDYFEYPHDDFQYPPPGKWIDCPEWDPKSWWVGGFHLMVPGASRFGFLGASIELVEYRYKAIIIPGDSGRARVRRLRRITCSATVLDEALRQCEIQVIRDESGVVSGGLAVAFGSATVRQTGGDCRAYDSATVELSGGKCRAYNSAKIVQAGGESRAYESAMVEQNGGECAAWDSAMVKQSGGECHAFGSVMVRQRGGYCRAYRSAAVEQMGGFAEPKCQIFDSATAKQGELEQWDQEQEQREEKQREEKQREWEWEGKAVPLTE